MMKAQTRWLGMVLFAVVNACGESPVEKAGFDARSRDALSASSGASSDSAVMGSAERGEEALSAQNPGQKGPFVAGFHYSEPIDTTRADYLGMGGRPVPIFLWYPVDATSVSASSP